MTQLDTRAQEIFNLIVDSFLETGEGMGSRTISKKLKSGISPATIRNTMSELQEQGLLDALHSSAPRFPSNAGLRLYINAYMGRRELDPSERAAIEAQYTRSHESSQGLFDYTSRVLSEMSSSVGLVVVPKKESPIRQIEFLDIEPGQALVLLVLEDGSVENRLITVPRELSGGDLKQAANFLSRHVSGQTIPEMNAIVKESVDVARKELDELIAGVVKTGMAIEPSAGSDLLVVQGAGNLIPDEATEHDLEEIQRLFHMLEERETATRLLEEAMKGDGVQIFVGSDNKVFQSQKLSMVLSPSLDEHNNIVGATGVIGPTRLNYRRVVPVVDYTSRLMSRLMRETG